MPEVTFFDMENEIHFLFECHHCILEYKKYLKSIQRSADINKASFLFKSQIDKLAKVCDIYDKRFYYTAYIVTTSMHSSRMRVARFGGHCQQNG